MPRKDRKSSQFDLRRYISRYDSNSETRIERLIFLARSDKCDSPKLAYSLLEAQLKQSGNAKRYAEIFGEGSLAAGDAMDVDTSAATGKESMSIIQSHLSSAPSRSSVLARHWRQRLMQSYGSNIRPP